MGLIDFILLFVIIGILLTPYIISKIKNNHKVNTCACGCDECKSDCPLKENIAKMVKDLK